MSILDAIARLAASPAMRAPLKGAPLTAEIPRLGRTIETLPDANLRAVAHLYARDAGIDFQPADVFMKVNPEDARAYAAVGAGFRAGGEENAFRHHLALYSDLARPGLTAETRGQNSWVNYGPFADVNKRASGAGTVYADQKAGLMPEFVYNRGVDDFRGPISLEELRKRILLALIYGGAGGGALGAIAGGREQRA